MKKTSAISLAKALKVKNRLAGRLAKVTSNIAAYNSMVQGRTTEANVADAVNERELLVKALINLKTAIYEGNRGIYRQIISIVEKKGEVQFLNALNTRNGSEPGYQGQDIVYVATLKKAEVDKRIKKLEKEIDDLQDEIDKYNAEPDRIKVEAAILRLAS